MSLRYPTDDTELKEIVRDETSYENTADELPDDQLGTIIERAKGRMELDTGSSAWYSDDGLGFALAAYACMRAKSAVENFSLSNYSIGDESVSFRDESPEDSQQIQQWAEDVKVGLEASDKDEKVGPRPTNTSGYIGETSIRDHNHNHDRLY
jgi:hypothetical protein